MSKLNEAQKIEYLSSGFHQYLVINVLNNQIMLDNDFANIVIKLEDLDWDTKDTDDKSGLGRLANFVNNTFSNFLFTPKNNFKQIFRYEYYQGCFFIRMEPFASQIAMHILPKKYEGFRDGDVLLFKDENEEYQLQKHAYYKRHGEPNINLYYQHKKDGVNAGDRPLALNPPKFSKFHNKFTYIDYLTDSEKWKKDTYQDTYGEYKYPISSKTANLDKIQINAGYNYNDSTSNKNTVHYTGIYDNHSIGSQKAVLIDANYDAENDFSNVITQLEWSNETSILSFPQNEAKAYQNLGFNNTHLNNIGKKFHKTIKYWNDTIFISERNDNNDIEDDYKIGYWTDPDIENGGN